MSEQSPTLEDNLLGWAKVLIAQLVNVRNFIPIPSSPTLRGEEKGPLTFAADGIIIVLNIETANAGRVNILGQIAAEDQDDWTGAAVELRKDNCLQASSTVDDLGAFWYEGIIIGQLELRIIPRTGSLVIMANFEVSA